MAKFLFIESRDPFETNGPQQTAQISSELRSGGHEVTYYLVQNATFGSRKARETPFSKLPVDVAILVDDYSLSERGIAPDEIHPRMKISSADNLVDLLMIEGQRAVWF